LEGKRLKREKKERRKEEAVDIACPHGQSGIPIITSCPIASHTPFPEIIPRPFSRNKRVGRCPFPEKKPTSNKREEGDGKKKDCQYSLGVKNTFTPNLNPPSPSLAH